MKAFTKISLMIAAISLGLGVLGVCIGLAMGAGVEDLSEMGIYISPYQKREVNRFTEDDIEEIMENGYPYKELEDFEDWKEFEFRHQGKHL